MNEISENSLIDHMAETGGWLPEDGIPVTDAALRSMERDKWIRLHRDRTGGIHSASLTAKGRARHAWGVRTVTA